MCWACKGKFVEGSGEVSVNIHNNLTNPILSEGSNFRGLAHNSCNLNVRRQYFLPVYIHNSNYDLTFIYQHSSFKNGEAIDGSWVDGFFL